jgi:ribosomal protein S6E (S10)
LALAKPVKQSKKIVSQSSGLSVTEKSSSTTVKISGGKTSSTSMGGGVATPSLTHALDLFDSGMSAADVAAAALVPH